MFVVKFLLFLMLRDDISTMEVIAAGTAYLIALLPFFLAYSILTMVIVLITRTVTLHRVRQGEIQLSVEDSEYYQKIARGEASAQVVSFRLHIALAYLAVLIPLGHFVPQSINDTVSDSDPAVFTLLGILLICTIATIVANWFWIYSKKVVVAEAYIIAHDKISQRFLWQRHLAWWVWIIYTLVLMVGFIITLF